MDFKQEGNALDLHRIEDRQFSPVTQKDSLHEKPPWSSPVASERTLAWSMK